MKNPNGLQTLPPKMAAEFAKLAQEGKADYEISKSCFEFIRGNQIITLVSLNPPCGHLRKGQPGEVTELRAKGEAQKAKAAEEKRNKEASHDSAEYLPGAPAV